MFFKTGYLCLYLAHQVISNSSILLNLHIVPCILNQWNVSLVHSVNNSFDKIKQCHAGQKRVLYSLGLNQFKNHLSNFSDLLSKFWSENSETIFIESLQALKLWFCMSWSHQSNKPSICKICLDVLPYLVLLFNVWKHIVLTLFLKSKAQILVLGHFGTILCLHAQIKVSDDPQKQRHCSLELLTRLCVVFWSNGLGQIDYVLQLYELVFLYFSQAIVDHKRA